VHFLLTDRPLLDLSDESADAIWSYDVFVHVNPVDARSYFREFRRVLRPGGTVVVHHPGPPPAGGQERTGHRSDLTDEMVLAFAKENDLAIVEQTREFVNEGDVLSVLRKP
jgi:SAM-dependent methyltransferase